jgi:hypothetical protein
VVPRRRVWRSDALSPQRLGASVAWAYFGSLAAPRACQLPRFRRTHNALVLATPVVARILMPTSRLYLQSRSLREASLIWHNGTFGNEVMREW